MKLFQIEEPDGSPTDPDAPGAAIGIFAGTTLAEVAFSVGGNAAILGDREGFERDLPVPALDAEAEVWQVLFVGARLRAERALARPVTHAVLAIAGEPDEATVARLEAAAASSGLALLAVVQTGSLAAAAEQPALAAAMLAEDTAPLPEAF